MSLAVFFTRKDTHIQALQYIDTGICLCMHIHVYIYVCMYPSDVQQRPLLVPQLGNWFRGLRPQAAAVTMEPSSV